MLNLIKRPLLRLKDPVSLTYYYFAGFKCKDQDSFQCDNGQCVSKDLVCDGDMACADSSDEKGCVCLTSQFECPSGECLNVDKLCDSSTEMGCKDGTDETRCGKKEL